MASAARLGPYPSSPPGPTTCRTSRSPCQLPLAICVSAKSRRRGTTPAATGQRPGVPSSGSEQRLAAGRPGPDLTPPSWPAPSAFRPGPSVRCPRENNIRWPAICNQPDGGWLVLRSVLVGMPLNEINKLHCAGQDPAQLGRTTGRRYACYPAVLCRDPFWGTAVRGGLPAQREFSIRKGCLPEGKPCRVDGENPQRGDRAERHAEFLGHSAWRPERTKRAPALARPGRVDTSPFAATLRDGFAFGG